MMDWLQQLSDDEKALVGCGVALLLCGTLMSLSYYVGRMLRRADAEPQEPYTVRMPEPSHLPAKTAAQPAHASTEPSRRAA
jgi:hypothetical protein